jgi:hypothetical protein
MKTTNCARLKFPPLRLGIFLVALGIAANVAAETPPALAELCRAAVAADQTVAAEAIRALRERGPEGLEALLTTHADVIRQHANAPRVLFSAAKPDDAWLRLRAALDGVGQQRDCYASQLYWHTDFARARTAALAQGKPILSLRLLGKLDEEFSCANSRFFRTTLYANAEVARYLREHFVLHWKSVRPVPRVTIDFGDGRKLERTITGNSIHYVLTPDGEVVDALPGLYGAKAFVRGLQRAEEIAQQYAAKPSGERSALLAAYHRNRVAILTAELEQDLQRVSITPALLTRGDLVSPVAMAAPPTAQAAARIASYKGRVERPILDRTTPEPPSASRTGDAAIDEATWKKIAALRAEDAALDQGAKELIRAKGPNAFEASRVAISKSVVEDPMLRKLRSMERSISEDTVRNEYLLHRQIHEWLASDASTTAVDDLNARVYAELFLTPNSDPWLGLLPADAYAALENDGLSLSARQ